MQRREFLMMSGAVTISPCGDPWTATTWPGDDDRPAELRVGRAAVRITPPVGAPMGSSYGLTISTGVHDELYAKALVIEQAGARAALVACDLISLRPPLVKEARTLIERATGLRAEQVILSATHAHCGPQMNPLFLSLIGGKAAEVGEAYRAGLPAKIVEAVRLAVADLRPARAWAGTGHEAGTSFNRRYLMRDGSVVMNPRKGDPTIVRPASGIDPDVGVVYFESLEKEPLATFVNFSMHCAIAGGSQFSADYPHVLARVLGRIKEPQMLTLFTMGAAGDVNHLDIRDLHQPSGQVEVERCGTVLAGEVLKTYARLEPLDPAAIRFRTEHLELSPREMAPGDLEKARAIFPRYGKPGGPPFLDVVWAWRTLEVAELGDRPLEVDVQGIALGDKVAWVGLPGEIFVDLGLAVKKASPFRYTSVSGMSASGTISYVPTRQAFQEGSYEVVSARIASGGGEKLVEAAVRILNALHPDRSNLTLH